MKEIVIRSGFHPETPRTYNGEHIYKIVETRTGGVAHDFQIVENLPHEPHDIQLIRIVTDDRHIEVAAQEP